MDRFGPTGKSSKKQVHLLRWTTFLGRTGRNFGSMDRAHVILTNTFGLAHATGVHKRNTVPYA